MLPLHIFCLYRRPNPFHWIVHNIIDQLIVDCSPLCKSSWKHKVDIKVLSTQLLQNMVTSQQIGILIQLLLRDSQILFILGSFWTKRTEEALRIIQDIILPLGREKSWWVALTVLGAFTNTSESWYPSTQNDVFKGSIKLFQGMEYLPGCPNINRF